MAAAGSFCVPFVVGGVAAASVLAWRLDARRASRSLRAMYAMAASVTVWTGVAMLLHRTPAESLLMQTARVVRRVPQLTPREEASRTSPNRPTATTPAPCWPRSR